VKGREKAMPQHKEPASLERISCQVSHRNWGLENRLDSKQAEAKFFRTEIRKKDFPASCIQKEP